MESSNFIPRNCWAANKARTITSPGPLHGYAAGKCGMAPDNSVFQKKNAIPGPSDSNWLSKPIMTWTLLPCEPVEEPLLMYLALVEPKDKEDGSRCDWIPSLHGLTFQEADEMVIRNYV
ncbi:predicted protein [Histoplasma capsulatum H143]|uniref:Uncharacterized protein n=1 Tax=Ajellomyces capsulatus (strain H143) TaxID=544712 RepID=C6H704_AJECH|nr:predicted protein [Histoplasma capsulatum H143]